MSFRRPKPKVIFAEDEDVDDGAEAVPFKKPSSVAKNKKRSKVNFGVDDLVDQNDGEADEVIQIKLKPNLKARPNTKKLGIVPSALPGVIPDEEETDAKGEDDLIYTSEYLESLKRRNNVKAVPKDTSYTIIDSGPAEKQTIIPDELEVKEQLARQANQLKNQLVEEAQDEDDDGTPVRAHKDIDKHVDFEIDLHDGFADERLPLTAEAAESGKQRQREDIQMALDDYHEDEQDRSDLKVLPTLEEMTAILQRKIDETADVEEHMSEQVQQAAVRLEEIEKRKAQVRSKLDELAKQYT